MGRGITVKNSIFHLSGLNNSSSMCKIVSYKEHATEQRDIEMKQVQTSCTRYGVDDIKVGVISTTILDMNSDIEYIEEMKMEIAQVGSVKRNVENIKSSIISTTILDMNNDIKYIEEITNKATAAEARNVSKYAYIERYAYVMDKSNKTIGVPQVPRIERLEMIHLCDVKGDYHIGGTECKAGSILIKNRLNETECTNFIENPGQVFLCDVNDSYYIGGSEYKADGVLVTKRKGATIDETSDVIRNTRLVQVVKTKALDYVTNIDTAMAVKSEKPVEGYENMDCVQIEIVDLSSEAGTGAGSTGGATGGDLKNLVFTVQQMAFFEFKFRFVNNPVKEIFNLPTGLVFDEVDQKITGTPTQSGRYAITVTLEDGATVSGIIEVPKLRREI